MNVEEVYELIVSNSEHLFGLSDVDCNFKIISLDSGTYTCAFSIETDNKKLPKLFIKRKYKSENDKDTQKEYFVMKDLWDEKKYSSSNLFCIAEPIYFIEDDNFLVTRFIEGNLLSRKLSKFFFTSYFFRPKKILTHIDRVSEWLIDYEKRVHIDDYKINLSDYVKIYLDRKVDTIDFIGEGLKTDIKESLSSLSKNLGEVPCHLVNTDFNPGNILVNENSTTAIDWEKTEQNGLMFWMPSTFLRYINMYSGRLGTSQRKLDLLKNHFLDNYLSNSIFESHKSFFPIVYILENLTYLSETITDSGKPSRIQKNSLTEVLRILEIKNKLVLRNK